MIHSAIENKLDIIRKILTANHVKKAYLFGSVIMDRFDETSDVDVVVSIDETLNRIEYGRCYWNILFSLEDQLHRNIDLLTYESLKNPYFIEELKNTRVEIL
ncbi:MAG: nucleotidyltransferase domain-containing protein [Leptospiraceae bacterium]|nr:nucleotidyltransferase domain-containing protein [Leptospiraceae bacterium]